MKKYLAIILFFFLVKLVVAQDTFYGISNGAFLYENPANAGTSGDLRFNNIYKNQFSILSGNYNTNFLSVDFKNKNSGVGAYFLADQSGTASVRKLEFAAIYSYLTQLTDKVGLSFGLGVGGGQSRLNFNSAIFEDQLQNDFSVLDNSSENITNSSKAYFDVNSGILIFSERFWLGIGIHHINKPKIYSIQNEARLNRKLGLQVGYIYNLSSRKMVNHNLENKNQAVYSLNSVLQGNLWRTSLGAKLFYNGFIGNLSISNISIKEVNLRGALLGLGVKYDLITFVYGYEFYLGNELKVGGAHEVQVKINLFHNNKMTSSSFKSKKRLKTFCPIK